MIRLKLYCETCDKTEEWAMRSPFGTKKKYPLCPLGHEQVVEWSGGGPEWAMRSHSYTGRRTTAGRKPK